MAASSARAAASAEEGGQPAAQIKQAFQLVVARNPTVEEQKVLENIYNRAQVRFASDPGAAANFLKNGDSPRNSELPEPEHAALATVCLGILNLDEVLTKE